MLPGASGVLAEVLGGGYVMPVVLSVSTRYIRQPEAYGLEILGDLNETTLTLDDIKKLPKHTVKMTLQCSGNRRTEMVAARTEENGLPPVRGLAWTNGAISTAEWSGAKLRDVLMAAGLTEDMPGVRGCRIAPSPRSSAP